MIQFTGILGKNCGRLIDPKQIDNRDKDFKVSNKGGYKIDGGIETLRGFASIKDLAKASKIDPAYQRITYSDHIRDISNFLDDGQTISKFLPEIILVGEKDKCSLTQFLLSQGTLTIRKQVEKLNYYFLDVEENSLKRIDGNHRLEAGKEKELYVPFAIILWPSSSSFEEKIVNRDNEALLFHILNSKAKKLTPEENFRGLANASTWTPEELRIIDKAIPFLNRFLKLSEQNVNYKSETFEEMPLTKIAEILLAINDFSMYTQSFDNFVNQMFIALNDFSKFPYLKGEFNYLLPQLIFYNFYHHQSIEFVIIINSWLQKYHYKHGSFECGKKMFDIVSKQLQIKTLKIFVAMPWYSLETVLEYNKIFKKIVKTVELKASNPNLRLELIPIMMRKGDAKRIDLTVMKEIEECDIFIADTTQDNPNVIFEIGYAMALSKKLFLVRDSKYLGNPPFDIDKLLYKPFNSDSLEESLSKTSILNLMEILKELNIIVPEYNKEMDTGFIEGTIKPDNIKFIDSILNKLELKLVNVVFKTSKEGSYVTFLDKPEIKINSLKEFESFILESIDGVSEPAVLEQDQKIELLAKCLSMFSESLMEINWTNTGAIMEHAIKRLTIT
jgi:nucleoside 2-deoxyribosyltransferase